MGEQRDAQSLLDVLRWRARHRPSSAAVGYRQAVLTFADLDRESAALAAALHRLGVQPGDRLALYLQSVPQVLIAQYAAWKLGAIVVPLNIMFKASELAYHLADAGAVGIVCLEEDVPRVLPVAEGAGLKFVISTGADDYSGESSGSAAAPGPRGDSPLSWRELLAAHRGGIKRVLIPKENERDLEEIPENVKQDLEIHPVRRIEDVLELALEQPPEGFSVASA